MSFINPIEVQLPFYLPIASVAVNSFFLFSCGIGTIAAKGNLFIGIYHAGKKLAVGFRAAFLYRRVLILSEIAVFVYLVGAACNLIDFFKQGSTVTFCDIDAAFFRQLFSDFGCRLFFGNEIIAAPVVYFGRRLFVCAVFFNSAVFGIVCLLFNLFL